MAKTEIHFELLENQRKLLEALATVNPKTHEELRKVIGAELRKARNEVAKSAKFKSDPREASRAVRRSVYDKILGGNVNILNSRRAHGVTSYVPTRKLDANPKQRGGNRVKRSPRTQQIMNYEGRDRGFILRFVNSGTYKANPRSTRLGNRGTITPRNWFTHAGQQQMQALTQRLSRMIDEEFKKLITQ